MYKERLSLISPYLPKDRASKRNPVIINPLPGKTGKTDSYPRRGDSWSVSYPDKLSYKLPYLPLTLLRARLSFVKVI